MDIQNNSLIDMDLCDNLTAFVQTYSNRTLHDIVCPTYARRSRSSYLEYNLAIWIVTWILPCIIFLGTIGNTIAFIVLLTRRMRHTSVNLYLAILACSDTSVLYFSGFRTWLVVITDFQMLHISNVGCKIIMFLFLLSLHMSAWLIVAISADRFLVIWFPLKSVTFCSVRRAQCWIGGLLVIMAGIVCHIFWTVRLQEHNGSFQCSAEPDNFFYHEIFPWLKLATYSCIPFVIVLALNLCIIWRIITSKRELYALGNDQARVGHNHSQIDHKVTTMLMVVSISWLLLTGPFMMFTLISHQSKDAHEKAIGFLMKTFFFLMMYINHSINFYLYCITGKRFRKEFFILFTHCLGRKETTLQSNRTQRTSLKSVRKRSVNGTTTPNALLLTDMKNNI